MIWRRKDKDDVERCFLEYAVACRARVGSLTCYIWFYQQVCMKVMGDYVHAKESEQSDTKCLEAEVLM